MSNLEKTDHDISDYFRSRGFSVQLGSKNPFSRIPVDQTLEETVNRDTQKSGGTKGFSLKPGTVEKYYITAEYRASALRQLRENLSLSNHSKFHHADLHKPRMKIDEECVSSIVQLLENDWTNPFDQSPSDIINLSTGRAAAPDVQTSLLSLKKRGEDAYETFKRDRLERGEGFFDPIKKINLKTFNTTVPLKKSGKNKEIILRADRKLYASMILIAENRHLNMLDVFSHPLGPLPRSLANPDGSIKKTSKTVLGKHLESLISPEDENISSSATIIDGMALIQKLHGENRTFDELSDSILNQILNCGYHSQRIDIVFDTYRDKSIKSAERLSRGSEEEISFKNIKSGHRIIKWRRLLQSNDSKNKLTTFLVESWQEENRRRKIADRTLFATYSGKCIEITASGSHDVEDLASSQEEADTRMMLHIKNAAMEYSNIICVSDDTDVLILALYISSKFRWESNIYIKRGTSGRIRLIDIKKLASAVGSHVTSALPGLHAWTGCDTVSAFSGQGKLKALKLLPTNDEFVSLFSMLGSQFSLSDGDHCKIQKFACQLYSRNIKTENINELRYQMFRSRQGAVESTQLPPCEDCLHQHSLRANYQTAIRKRCLENFPAIPEPEDHGWNLEKDGQLSIKWMRGAPAPEAVLELLSCSCSKLCRLPSCTCMVNQLKCTDACKLATCENMSDPEECREEVYDSYNSCGSDDDEEDDE
ncbi:unnamed protein product [Phaedon cochleariae]|uniref:Tesmin/TSO1-like CXC domain-containing protein n=1 Tax=Phaedon cochleariae TaxID=80249 RepID=A0A9N9X3I3_PHACE|nr:unnamed protein product [Phaedon cochleariae]